MPKALNNNKTRNPFKLIPWWGWVGATIFVLVLHSAFYLISRTIVISLKDTWWWYSPKIDSLDDKIPFMPYFFAQLYYVSYAVWFIVPLIVSVSGKKNFINFMIYSFIAHFIGFFLFILLPARQNRIEEGLPDKIAAIKGAFTKWMMNIIVKNDGGDTGWNMVPSFHVLSCFFCTVSLLRQKRIQWSIRVSDYTINILIILSTLFIKQHYIFDVVVALLLGSLVFIIVLVCDPGKTILDKHPNFLEIKKREAKK